MSRLIITILTTLMLGATQAEYTIKVPLQGESIQFKSPNTELPPQPPEPSEPPVCSFSLSSPSTYWFVVGSLESISYETGVYNGINIIGTPDINGKYPSVVIYEGNSYSRGSYIMDAGGDTHVYEICMKPTAL